MIEPDEVQIKDDATTLREFRLFGPPGTGKTTFIATQVRKWGIEHGYPNLALCSFSKTAASELAGRDTPLRRHQIGTLHSFAFRALGLTSEQVAESHIDEWNKEHPGYERSGGLDDVIDDPTMAGGKTDADSLAQQAEVLRQRRVPIDLWPISVKRYFFEWERWCQDNDLTDFTGMIEVALEDVESMPGNPKIAVMDEVQDSTLLEMTLMRKWSAGMEMLLVAGDDDQAIFSFRGADPRLIFAEAVPEGQRRVLAQSWRVPAKVHKVAQRWISRLSWREPKDYYPRRDDDGEVVEGAVDFLPNIGLRDAKPLVREAQADLDAGRSVMILASCGYQLQPIVRALREEGVVFANPWRRSRGDWNPIQRGGSKRRTATDRLLAYLAPLVHDRLWTWGELRDFVEPLRASDVLRHGAKEKLKSKAPSEVIDWLNDFETVFRFGLDHDAAIAIEQCDLDWFEQNLLTSKAKPFAYPLQIVRKGGIEALTAEPRLFVGTIHSFKGAQADSVYLVPDLAPMQYAEWVGSPEQKDAVVRQFYVAITRARERLVICGASSQRALSPAMFMRALDD